MKFLLAEEKHGPAGCRLKEHIICDKISVQSSACKVKSFTAGGTGEKEI